MPRRLLVLSVCCLLPLVACSAPPGGPARPAAAPIAVAADEDDGAVLYRAYCAECHRPLAKTTKPNRTVSRIHSSIRHFSAMHQLDGLTIDQIQAIAAVLQRP